MVAAVKVINAVVETVQNNIMAKNKKLICFDLDGVLISSMAIANQIFFDTVDEELGLPTEEWRKNKKMMALPAEERFYTYWEEDVKEKGITKEQIESTLNKYRKRKLEVDMPVLPGAIETVKLMADNFEYIAAVSSNKEYIIEETLDELGIRKLFMKVTGIDKIPFSKPHPEIYQVTVDYFGVSPKDALTFEDSSHGITSASSAGMKVIGVATGLESVEDLKKTDANVVLHDLTEFNLDIAIKLLES